MTMGREAIREALLLPVVFMTVLLLGGLHIADTTVLRFPSLFALVLGLLLLRVLVQSGAPRSGAAPVGLAIWFGECERAGGVRDPVAAAAQTFALLIPDSGLPRLAVNLFFLILLLNTAAAAPDRLRLLRSLTVTFGAAFVLKFILLQELSAPGSSGLKRVLQAMLEGLTLGALMQAVPHPVTGYVALFTVALFLIGVFLLPHRQPPPGSQRSRLLGERSQLTVQS